MNDLDAGWASHDNGQGGVVRTTEHLTLLFCQESPTPRNAGLSVIHREVRRKEKHMHTRTHTHSQIIYRGKANEHGKVNATLCACNTGTPTLAEL